MPQIKSAFSGEVDGTVYGLNEWVAVSKIKNTLIIIFVLLYGSHSSRLLHLPDSPSFSTPTHQHTQVKSPLMFQLMALQMWEMSGIQLVKYQNILTLISLVLSPTQISLYKT